MKHIRLTSTDTEAWCGLIIQDSTCFNSVEAAALHGRYNGEDTICSDCVDTVIEHLNSAKEEKT